MEPTAAGTFHKTPLAHLLVYCVDKRLRGTLVFRPAESTDNAHADVVTLVDGCPAKLKAADPIDHLGRILLETGAIDEVAYNESLMALGKGGGLQGQLLLQARKIDAATLESALRQQITRKLGHLFERPASTQYAYYDGVDLLARYGGPELYPVTPFGVIWTGIRAHPSLAHVDATLERIGGAPLRLRGDSTLPQFGLAPAERELAERVRTSALSAAQLQALGLVDVKTTRLLIYALILTKQLETVADAHAAAPRAPNAPIAPTPAPSAPTPAPTPAAASTPRTAAPSSVVPPAPSASRAPSSGGVSESIAAPKAVQSLSSPAPANAPRASRTGAIGDLLRKPTAGTPPSAATGVGGTPAVDRRAEILAKAAALTKETHFQILGIKPAASVDEAKDAYFQAAKRWHPDRLPGELADLKDDVARVFAAMADAYQTLTDPAKRERYLKLVSAGGGTQADAEGVQRALDATNAFTRGLFFVEKRSFVEAESHVNRAYELEPNDPDHVAVWCWVQANRAERKESQRFDDLLEKLDTVLRTAPKCERARFYRAMLLKMNGRVGDALRDFKEIAESNPRHTEAVREVRLHTMRSERDRKAKDDGGSSLLGKFMKKK